MRNFNLVFHRNGILLNKCCFCADSVEQATEQAQDLSVQLEPTSEWVLFQWDGELLFWRRERTFCPPGTSPHPCSEE